MTIHTIQKNKGLLQAFIKYQKRYIHGGKKIDLRQFFPEIVYRTMRLEGERITKKEARALFP